QGCLRRPGESQADYRRVFLDDEGRLSAKLLAVTGRAPTTLIYPFGLMSVDSERLVREAGFRASVSCVAGVNLLTAGVPEDLYRLKRCLRTYTVPVEAILRRYGA
ncbi:MAG: hypothetical protein LBT36_00640, partial [Oscillospiraceae bacterium]|nr:hypothetical protein [Oscillospiraceae bacterium]